MEKIWLLCPCMCMCHIFFAWQNFGRIDIMTETRKFGQKTYPDILMGRYLSLRRRYQMAAFSFIVALPHVWPCCVHDEWTDDLSVCPEGVGTGAMHRWWQRYLPEAVSLRLCCRLAWIFMCIWALFIHGIRGSVFDPWWVVPVLTLGWTDVEASVPVGKPVDRWSMIKSLSNQSGRASRASGLGLASPTAPFVVDPVMSNVLVVVSWTSVWGF